MCQKHMPVSSVIVGVDLVPIKTISNVITLTEDITTASCRSALRRELKTWKADLVLNDGAPNVGKSWAHDAFTQNRLTLSALELAAEFLVEGGTFVTKIFRSKDYNALIWVLSKLFRKVSATKPAASRNESAEIFVVAQHFLAPAKIDPKFFNPTYLFDDAINEEQEEKKSKNNLLLPVSKQKRPKAEGYRDGETSQFIAVKASDVIRTHTHLELMSRANEIVMDDEEIANHPATTNEIRECCKDIKVLGRKEILSLIKWRKRVRSELQLDKKKEKEAPAVEEIEEQELDPKTEEERKLRRKKKKVQEQRKKLKEQMNLKMIIKNDHLVDEGDVELFNLKKLRNKLTVQQFEEFSMSEDSDDEAAKDKNLPKYVSYDKEDKLSDHESADGSDDENEEHEEVPVVEDDASDGVSDELQYDSAAEDEEDNGLIHGSLTRSQKTNMFFKKGVFTEVMSDSEDDDKEILETLDQLEPKTNNRSERGKRAWHEDDDDEDEDSISGAETRKLHPKCQQNVKLDPESLALAEQMIVSSKGKRDLIDDAWNRYTRGEEDGAPSWFRKDEDKFFRKTLSLDPDALKRYRDQQKELNVRPIKKVAEAKARKKKRALQRLERIKKKAETISETPDMTEKEKSAHLRNLYKKSARGKKQEVSYVVAKKGRSSGRPSGVKGKYKMVDKRLKKDNRKKKLEAKSKGKGRSGKKFSKGRK